MKIYRIPPTPPTPPKFPPAKILREGSIPWCPMCHSSRAYRGFLNLFPLDGCISPNCSNYYKTNLQSIDKPQYTG